MKPDIGRRCRRSEPVGFYEHRSSENSRNKQQQQILCYPDQEPMDNTVVQPVTYAIAIWTQVQGRPTCPRFAGHPAVTV
jgi:hypothetical protein